MSKKNTKRVLGYIALALVCVFAGTVIGSARPAAVAEEKVVLTSPFTEAISKVRDSVVGVNNYQIVNNYGSYGGSGFGDFPWSYFGFGNGNGNGYGNGYGNGRGNGYGNNQPESSEEVKYGSGSGVVVAEGYVLTNYHVVENASSLKISLGDDEEYQYEATVAAYDADKDIAVLRVPNLPVNPVELGDSDALEIGDWVVNIGNAIGFTGTVTAGIVSGLNREIPGDGNSVDKYGRATKIVNKMIQTDAAINSGNSGGGMFNTAGELVGIPTLKYTGTRYSGNAAVESIGMCIPINEAKDLIEQAKTGAAAEAEPTGENQQAAEDVKDLKGKPRMGVTVTTLGNTKGMLPAGAYVISVEANSPAEAGGIKAGDIMVELNGEVISSVDDQIRILEKLGEGDQVAVKVFRPATVEDAERARISTDGEYIDLTVTLALVDAVAQ